MKKKNEFQKTEIFAIIRIEDGRKARANVLGQTR